MSHNRRVVRLLPENTYLADPALRAQLESRLGSEARHIAEPQLVEVGKAAAGELFELAEQAERNPPVLRSIDPWGQRVDEVVYGEAWQRIGLVATRAGLVYIPYHGGYGSGSDARVVQAALCYLFGPSSATYSCPVAMTDAAARVLLDYGPAQLRDEVVPHLVATDTEQAWTAGQWMTEQQGGSDVGRNEVEARQEDGRWRLYGRKYFCSNVDGEVTLALARPERAPAGTKGLGLFLIRRTLPDGSHNRWRIDRLKDKLGTRAMATGEVTLDGAEAELVGELDHGFQQMTPMLNLTRLHNAVASVAAERRGVMLARCYAAQREAFGKRLDQQPLQRQVLLELAVRAEADLALVLRLAELLGRVESGEASDEERLLFRVGTSIAKLYTARQAVQAASEAIECFGGAGYMEDTGLARLLRDAQVLPIWEGTTNVLSLDVTRLLGKPGMVEAFAAELTRLGRRWQPQSLPQDPEQVQPHARRLAFEMAIEWIGGLVIHGGSASARTAELAALWESDCEPASVRPGAFERIVDGAA